MDRARNCSRDSASVHADREGSRAKPDPFPFGPPPFRGATRGLRLERAVGLESRLTLKVQTQVPHRERFTHTRKWSVAQANSRSVRRSQLDMELPVIWSGFAAQQSLHAPRRRHPYRRLSQTYLASLADVF